MAAVNPKLASLPSNPSLNRKSAIPFIEQGQSGAPVVFLHANGFPPACYEPLLEKLMRQFHVKAMLQRPLWPNALPDELADWHILSRDLLRFLDEQKQEHVIAVGHSMGAIAALRAALWEPQRFAALVLLEPVLLPRHVMWEWKIIRMTRLGQWLHPLIPGALRRQRVFENRETAFQRYRGRPIFRYFSNGSLRAYIGGMTEVSPGGRYQLVYSPEWEARIYDTAIWNDWDLWRDVGSLRVPTLIVRGAESDTLRASVTRAVEKLNRQVRIEVMQDSTHLLPLEQPEATSALIQAFVDQLQLSSKTFGE